MVVGREPEAQLHASLTVDIVMQKGTTHVEHSVPIEVMVGHPVLLVVRGAAVVGG